MLQYQMVRPKPPHHSGLYEKVRWRDGDPLKQFWVMQEIEGTKSLRAFFINDANTLLLPVSERAGMKLASMFSVNGFKLRDKHESGAAWLYDFEFETFTLPITDSMTPKDMLDTAKRPEYVVYSMPLAKKPVIDLTSVIFLKPKTVLPAPVAPLIPAAQPALAPAPGAPIAVGPNVTETLAWTREQLFAEYWKLRDGTFGPDNVASQGRA